MFKIRIISKCYKHLIVITLVIFIKGLIADSIQRPSLESDSDLSLCSNLSLDNIDCSKQNFTTFPFNIPKNAIRLNFSFNNLGVLTDDTFGDCCDNVIALDLSNNNIHNISSRSFKNLLKLETLILDSNLLTLLDLNLFFNLTTLRSLSLSNNNRIQLTRPDHTDEGFLNSKSLLELNLDNCNIDQIPSSTFKYLNQLTSLNLANNPINKNIQASSFKPLENSILHLRLPEISDQSVFELCDKLTTIDVIRFDSYNISCFLLSDSSNLKDSIVLNDPDIIIEEPKINFVIEEAARRVETTRVPKNTIPITTIRLPEVSDSTMKNETIKNGMHLNTNVPFDNITTTSTTPDIEMEKSTFDISNETLKMVLIGIFAIAVFGVVLGIICRYCGIKTKLCRTKKNRTTNEDTVAAFEMENLNENGKTSQTIA